MLPAVDPQKTWPRPLLPVWVAISTLALLVSSPVATMARSDDGDQWPTFDGDASRTGVNSQERTLNSDNVANLNVIWSAHLPGPVDSSPVYRNHLLYLTLTNGSTVAVDADSGQLVWVAQTTGPRFTTSTPVLDPNGSLVYSYGLDGYVHRYSTANGQEDTTAGWPIQLTTMPNDEKGSSALNLADGRLYATISGYPSDGGHYQGHLVTIDLRTGQSTIFNSLCSNLQVLLGTEPGSTNYCASIQSGIWARAGTVVDPATGRLFLATGNGPWDGATNWGDSVLALSLDGRTLLDSYTPTNQDLLNSNDTDLGSSAPVLLPQQPSSVTPTLTVLGSKDGELRLLNRSDLSGHGHPGELGGELQVLDGPKGCEIRSTPIAWNAPDGNLWIFVTNECALGGYVLQTDASGQSRLAQQWLDSPGASSPLIANGVLFVARGQTLQARDPLSGRVLWSSDQIDASIAVTHWNTPIVMDGRVFVGDAAGSLIAFGLPSPGGANTAPRRGLLG